MDVLSLAKAALLGVVEGITEFLPISSTGHLILVERFVSLSRDTQFVKAFDVVIQLGAILAIVVLFWGRLWPWAAAPGERARTWRLWARVGVATVPAFVLGYLLEGFVTERLFRPEVVAAALVFYGVVLILVEKGLRRRPAAPERTVHDLPLLGVLCIGLFQALALVPGTSRAAATIIGGMILGLGRGAAAEFSFFLAIPVMVGASGLTLVKRGLAFGAGEWTLLAVGFVVAFLSAIAVVRAFVGYLQGHDFVPFGWYRIGLGIVVIVAMLLRG